MGQNKNNIINEHDIMCYYTILKVQKMFRVDHNRNLESCDEETDWEN